MKEQDLETRFCETAWLRGPIEIVGRQVSLLNGILDVLAMQPVLIKFPSGISRETTRILAIELKAVPLHEKHLGQLLRYVTDLRMFLDYLAMIHPTSPEPGTLRWEAFCQGNPQAGAGISRIVPVLVSPQVSTLLAHTCSGAGIETYEFSGEGRPQKVNGLLTELDCPPLSSRPWAQTVMSRFYQDYDAEIEADYEDALRGLFGGQHVQR